MSPRTSGFVSGRGCLAIFQALDHVGETSDGKMDDWVGLLQGHHGLRENMAESAGDDIATDDSALMSRSGPTATAGQVPLNERR